MPVLAPPVYVGGDSTALRRFVITIGSWIVQPQVIVRFVRRVFESCEFASLLLTIDESGKCGIDQFAVAAEIGTTRSRESVCVDGRRDSHTRHSARIGRPVSPPR